MHCWLIMHNRVKSVHVNTLSNGTILFISWSVSVMYDSSVVLFVSSLEQSCAAVLHKAGGVSFGGVRKSQDGFVFCWLSWQCVPVLFCWMNVYMRLEAFVVFTSIGQTQRIITCRPWGTCLSLSTAWYCVLNQHICPLKMIFFFFFSLVNVK